MRATNITSHQFPDRFRAHHQVSQGAERQYDCSPQRHPSSTPPSSSLHTPPMIAFPPFQAIPRVQLQPPASHWSWSPPPKRASTWSVHGYPKMEDAQVPHSAMMKESPARIPDPQRFYTSIPLPPQVDPNVDVIPFLRSGTDSCLDLDLRKSTTELGLRGGRGGEIRRHLAVAATTPSIPSLTVVHSKLPWPITVHRSERAYVTVWDVLVTIVESLQIPLKGLTKSTNGEDVWLMDIV
ncbi:hypothetical protein K435DRAFT_794843 [Dendrothele bispora CBS 962.96]|uniref:DUF6699 domain-containing protein n=1 Tax=Dendrothele bispora (strain CBS 962.96) TaxID=1314807 RepID=A0A4S8MC89_DENBC|nr:hypothetical protein K435DRAFT_794843 [Dendrothele bispora CBS 962.96]